MRIPHKPTPAETLDLAATHRSEGVVTSLDLFDGPGILDGILVGNNTATETYIHIWDRTAVPADTTVPDFPPITLPASTTIALDFGERGVAVKLGACISISSTRVTTTLSANAAFIVVTVRT